MKVKPMRINTHPFETMNGEFQIRDNKLVFVSEQGVKRRNWASKLRTYSRIYLKNNCEVCNGKESLNIHHIIPLKYMPNVTKENCVTLCRECHTILEGLAKSRCAGFLRLRKMIKQSILKIRKSNRDYKRKEEVN